MRVPLASASSPPSIEVSPDNIRSRVVLPAPLRQAMVMRSRRSSLNETPRSNGSPAMSLLRSEAMRTATTPMVGCAAMRSGLIGLVLAVVLAGPAAAAERVTAIPGAGGPGPAKYDKVFVTKFGPKNAKRVLLLMPGFYGGAGDFTLDAREIVKRVPGLQVWALDRRSQALEDTGRFADALAGRIGVQQAFDYYLGWLANPAIQPHFQPLDPARFAFAKQWGLS